jgi:hypothetical protein
MLKGNCRAAKWLLSCAAALLVGGCATIPDQSSFGKARVASDCPGNFLPYCVDSGHDTKCGCMPTQTVETTILRRYR